MHKTQRLNLLNLFELCELMQMGCKDIDGSQPIELPNRTRDNRQSRLRFGTVTNLITEYEGVFARAVEDIFEFQHLDREGREPFVEVVP